MSIMESSMTTKEKLEIAHYQRIGWLMALGGSGLVWLAIFSLIA